MIRRLWFAIVGCGHPSTFRERRDHAGVSQVMCFVCASCGASWPVVSRTEREHREAQAAGTPIVARGVRKPKDNVKALLRTGTL